MSSKKHINLFLFYWVPLISYCTLIFISSHLSTLSDHVLIPLSDTCIHFTEYFLLCFIAYRAFVYSSQKRSHIYLLIWSGVFSFLYAVSDEFHQSFIPGRDASIFDVLADGGGILVALGLIWIKKGYARKEIV